MDRYETKFYKLLLKAREDEASLVIVIDKIMPLINKYSLNKDKEIDEDLKSVLVEHTIKIIKRPGFAKNLSKK